jgi:hypothetical protein
MTEKAQEILQADQTPSQMEAFPSQEARVDAILDKAIADTKEKQAELAADKPSDAPEKPKEAAEATPEPEKASEPPKEPEKASETPAEPQLSARERFARDAEKEAKDRAERQEVKEWKDKYTSLEKEVAELRQLQNELKTDPEGFFDRRMPTDTYEKITQAYAKGEKPSAEKAELTALRNELKALRDDLKTTREETSKVGQQNWIKDFMRDVDRLSVADDFKAIHEFATEVERVTGEPINLHQAAAKEYDDFFTMYQKQLTPREVLEILNEKAEERMSKIRPEPPAQEEKKPEPKKAAKKPAATVTNELETESDSGDDDVPFTGDKESHIQRVAEKYDDKMWQGNQEK